MGKRWEKPDAQFKKWLPAGFINTSVYLFKTYTHTLKATILHISLLQLLSSGRCVLQFLDRWQINSLSSCSMGLPFLSVYGIDVYVGH